MGGSNDHFLLSVREKLPYNREVEGRNGYFDDGKCGGIFIRGG